MRFDAAAGFVKRTTISVELSSMCRSKLFRKREEGGSRFRLSLAGGDGVRAGSHFAAEVGAAAGRSAAVSTWPFRPSSTRTASNGYASYLDRPSAPPRLRQAQKLAGMERSIGAQPARPHKQLRQNIDRAAVPAGYEKIGAG